MIYNGLKAIDQLAKKVPLVDPGESSHWKKYHIDFQYANGKLKGIKGFGGCSPVYTGVRKYLHKYFLTLYRAMGHKYADFQYLDSLAKKITESQGRAYDLDVLRQTLTVSLLSSYGDILGPDKSILVIGDGFASISSILISAKKCKRIVLVNLSKTLLVDLLYLYKWMGEAHFSNSVALIDEESDINSLSDSISIVAIEAANHELIRRFNFDLAINIASMQEMHPDYIKNYFEDFSYNQNENFYFYCCNREEKTLPDNTVTRFQEYPWNESDIIVLDELCPWHQKYYSFIPPFYRKYDGPIRHQLRKMKF